MSDRSHKDALAAKDATVELFKARVEELSNIKTEYNEYRRNTEKHQIIADENLALLHKRFSD